jgi:hypothetical protein
MKFRLTKLTSQTIERLLRSHLSVLLIFLTLATIFRNGFSLYGLRWKQYNSSPKTELVCEYRDCGQLYVAHNLERFGFTYGALPFFTLYFVLIVLGVIIVCRQILNMKEIEKSKALVLVSFLPASTIILQRFGTFDAIPLLMSIIGVLARTKFGAFVAALIIIGTNPEAAIVSGAGLALLHLIVANSKDSSLNFPKNTLWFGVFQVVMSTPLIAVGLFDNTGGSAVEAILFVDSLNALAQLIASGPLLIFSWFGALWYVLVKILGSFERRLKFHIYSLIILVGCITLIASDGTRNSALGLTSLMVALLFSSAGCEQQKTFDKKVLIALYFIPAINIANFNIVLPFYQILYILDLARPILIAQ